MCALSTEIRRQGHCLNLEGQDVVVVVDVLSDPAVDISRQVFGVSVGADHNGGGDFNDEGPHWIAAACPNGSWRDWIARCVTDCERAALIAHYALPVAYC
jgi:hypothetical protein